MSYCEKFSRLFEWNLNNKEKYMKINKWLLVTTLALSSIGLVSCQQKKVQEAEVVSSASVKTPREIIKSPAKKYDTND